MGSSRPPPRRGETGCSPLWKSGLSRAPRPKSCSKVSPSTRTYNHGLVRNLLNKALLFGLPDVEVKRASTAAKHLFQTRSAVALRLSPERRRRQRVTFSQPQGLPGGRVPLTGLQVPTCPRP